MSKDASFLGTVNVLFMWRRTAWMVGEGGFPHDCRPDPGFYQGDESVQSYALDLGKGAHALGRDHIQW